MRITMKHAFGAVVLAGLSAVPAMAQEAAAADAADAAVIAERAAPADPLRFDLGEGSVKIAIEAGAQVVAQSNAFWNLAEALAPAENFDPDPAWGEFYVEAGATFEHPIGASSVKLGVSAVAAQTVGSDIFGSDDEGRIVLEDAYAALRLNLGGDDKALTLSGGAQSFKLGTGMLIGEGGVDGFERGALIFGPRSTWEMTGIARLELGKVTLQGFHLNPRELDSGDSRTIINGASAEVKIGANGTAGLAYGHVPRSEAPSIQAAPGGAGVPTLIFNGRDGLSFVQAWFKVSPIKSLPTFYVSGDYARQRNGRIDLKAWAGRIEVGNTFIKAPWMPTVSYSYTTFSGDDPDTPELERFDPMFYDGAQAGWATGTNGSFVLINSNLRAHRLSVVATPSPRDIVTFRAVTIAANELFSPIQFGQATRPSLDLGAPGVVTGVSTRHLSDDILFEYTRVLTPNIFATVAVGHSWVGDGQRSLAPGLTDWTGGLLNIVVKY
jgi:hypothetical protein